MAKQKPGRTQDAKPSESSVQKRETVEPTPCGIQFESELARKGHIERHSCCNYTMYSSAYRQQRRA